MDPPHLSGINVPDWKCHRTSRRREEVHHEAYACWRRFGKVGISGAGFDSAIRPNAQAPACRRAQLDAKRPCQPCAFLSRSTRSPLLRLIVGRAAHLEPVRRVPHTNDLPSASVRVIHAHRVVRGAPWNKFGRQRGKHDALPEDDLLPLGNVGAGSSGSAASSASVVTRRSVALPTRLSAVARRSSSACARARVIRGTEVVWLRLFRRLG